MLIPIARELTRLGRPFTFLGLTSAISALQAAGIPAIGFRDLPGSSDDEVQRWGKHLAKDLSAGGVVTYEETVAYLGASFRDLVRQFGEEEAWQRYGRAGRQAFFPVPTLRRAIQHLAPRLVVATNSPRAERAAIVAAGQLGVPSMCVVDLFALQEVKWIGQPGYATKICVLNESVRRMFLEHGRQAHEIEVTGNPAFDRLTAPETIAAGAELRRARGWNDGRRSVLWASQVEPERHPFDGREGDPMLPRRIERALRDLVTTQPGLRLVIRYHPNEHVEFVPAANVELSPVSEPVSALLHAVDAVVVTASTVGLEAAIAGRPVISVDLSLFTLDTLYASMSVSKGVSRIQDIGPAVLQALDSQTLPFCQGKSGRSATQEILGVMDSLLV